MGACWHDTSHHPATTATTAPTASAANTDAFTIPGPSEHAAFSRDYHGVRTPCFHSPYYSCRRLLILADAISTATATTFPSSFLVP